MTFNIYQYIHRLKNQNMKFNCGIIGLGRIGCGFDDIPGKKSIDSHSGAYNVHPQANIVALCDIDENKLKKYGIKYGIKSLYVDAKKMFKEESLDCVSICTLADSHLSLIKEASKHKIKGIFLEKPISISLKDAKNIIKICKKNKIKLQIDHQRRFSPFYQKIKKLMNDKKIGELQHCSIYYGSGVANTGSHIFDLINYFFEGIKWVEATQSKNISNNILDPNINGKFECKNNLVCTIQSFDYDKFSLLEFDIIGTKGRIKLNLTDSKAEFFIVSGKLGLAYKKLIKKSDIIKKNKDDIVLGVENLFDSMQNKTKLLSSGNEGYASLENIIAMKLSANKNGKRVELPIKSNSLKISSK